MRPLARASACLMNCWRMLGSKPAGRAQGVYMSHIYAVNICVAIRCCGAHPFGKDFPCMTRSLQTTFAKQHPCRFAPREPPAWTSIWMQGGASLGAGSSLTCAALPGHQLRLMDCRRMLGYPNTHVRAFPRPPMNLSAGLTGSCGATVRRLVRASEHWADELRAHGRPLVGNNCRLQPMLCQGISTALMNCAAVSWARPSWNESVYSRPAGFPSPLIHMDEYRGGQETSSPECCSLVQ